MKGEMKDYDSILKAMGKAKVVMIGEASHGTHEFYKIRADITKRLIEEKEFSMVAVEGDWPDVYRINRYVCGKSEDKNAREALGDFSRFPRWMWRNTVVEICGMVEILQRQIHQHLRESEILRIGPLRNVSISR